MTFSGDIISCEQFLRDAGLAPKLIRPDSLPVNPDFNQVALDLNSTPTDMFLAGLDLVYYNILLEDYSFFQFSASQDESDIRMGFYPNPFTPTGENHEYLKWVKEGRISDEEYSRLLQNFPPDHNKISIRYDCAPNQYAPFKHPAFHFHFGNHPDWRWPSWIKLNPLLFGMFITKINYPEYWTNYGEDTLTGGNKFEKRLSQLARSAVKISTDLIHPDEINGFGFDSHKQ